MNKINNIKQEFIQTPINEIKFIIDKYINDERQGVKNIVKSYQNKLIKYKKELLKMEVMKKYEKEAYENGKTLICGIDEVGRGCLAGPVFTACAILPKDFNVLGIDDSKKLTEKKRIELYEKIKENALYVDTYMEDNTVIDDINILEATKKCMLKNIDKLAKKPDYLILDAIKINTDIPYVSIIKADQLSISVASASIIAKVTRDEYMKKIHNIYPQYKFNENKGYGTEEHIKAIEKYGICPVHRKSFLHKYIQK